MQSSVIFRLRVARNLFQTASEHERSRRSVSAIISINLLQDAVETFLLAAAEHLDLQVNENTKFPDLVTTIGRAIGGHLPFQARLNVVNRMRVQSKHHTVTPNQNELSRMIVAMREFFDEAGQRIFGKPLWQFGSADEVSDSSVRKLIEKAEQAFADGDHRSAIINIRKAFYIAFEAIADINPESSNRGWLFNQVMWIGPSHPMGLTEAQIQDHVQEPFDYIYFDELKLERDLRRDGIDPVVFDNIRSTTPAVYFHNKRWFIREDDALVDSDIAERTTYALEHVPDLILRRQVRIAAMKPSPFGYGVWLRGMHPQTPMYRSASRKEPIGLVSDLGPHFQAAAKTPSLDGGDDFFATASADKLNYVYVAADEVEDASPQYGDDEPDDDQE